MSCKIVLVICAVLCVVSTLEAASIKVVKSTGTAVHKLDYEKVQENVRGSRQAYEDASGEDSDEDDDDEDDAEQLQQQNIRQQEAQEQAVDESQEASDEDDEDADNEEESDDDDSSFFGRRLKRDVAETELTNEIEENSKPVTEEVKEKEPSEESLTATDVATAAPSAPATPNTSVLILIRDAIKKVTTELPNTQQVATSAQQYFQLFEHFLQQTIEQVIGDDDEEDEAESTTIAPELAAPENDKVSETSDKVIETESTDKETTAAIVSEVPVSVNKPEVPVAEDKPESVASTQVDTAAKA